MLIESHVDAVLCDVGELTGAAERCKEKGSGQ